MLARLGRASGNAREVWDGGCADARYLSQGLACEAKFAMWLKRNSG